MLNQEQINKVCEFEASLNPDDEWLFFHLAWAHSKIDVVTFEDKYEIMKRWDEFKQPEIPAEKEREKNDPSSGRQGQM